MSYDRSSSSNSSNIVTSPAQQEKTARDPETQCQCQTQYKVAPGSLRLPRDLPQSCHPVECCRRYMSTVWCHTTHRTANCYHFHCRTVNTHTAILRPFVRVYPGEEPGPEETSIHSHPSCSSTILISFLHLPRTIASSLLYPRTWQSLCTTSNHVLFGLPLGLEPTTSYSIHFFTQSLSSFRNTCPYHRSLFCCSSCFLSTSGIPKHIICHISTKIFSIRHTG